MGVAAPKKIYHCAPGQWGDLEYYYTFLQAPDETIGLLPVPSETTAWHFPGYQQAQVEELFGALSLPDGLHQALLDEGRWASRYGGISVYPPPEVIEQLTPEARLQLALVLRQWDENPHYKSPAVIESGDVRNWYAGSGLPPDLIAKIEQLAYPKGKALAFSDLPYLLREIQTDEGQHNLLKAMSRTRTLVLRLRLSKSSDLATLEDYWTVGYKHQDVLPILRSVVATQGVEQLDASHLLPPVGRKLLFSYPSLAHGLNGRLPDCHWTCANFFNNAASDHLVDFNSSTTHFNDTLVPNPEPHTFGDVLTLALDGSPVHSCIYIADDIVYTKNGGTALSPWILMKLSDMISRYHFGERLEIQGYRAL